MQVEPVGPQPRRARPRTALVVGGWLLVLAGVVLPWTHNRAMGSRRLLQSLERQPDLVVLYASGLLALGVAAAVLVRHGPALTAVVPAAAGAVTVLGVVLATPRGESNTIGFDSAGRMFEVYDRTVWSAGPACAAVGAVLVLGLAVRSARGRREPT